MKCRAQGGRRARAAVGYQAVDVCDPVCACSRRSRRTSAITCGASLGFGTDIFAAPWPEPDESALEQDEIELVLQINGKTRGKHPCAERCHRESEIEAAGARAARSHKSTSPGRRIKKVVVVPGRLVNVVY